MYCVYIYYSIYNIRVQFVFLIEYYRIKSNKQNYKELNS